MASLPVAMIAMTESSLMIHSRYLGRSWCSFAENRRSRSVRFSTGSSGSRFGFLRSARKGSVEGGESEDVLQATIEKSKKVLAKQRDLLQQISERRKVGSSKNGSIDHENVEVPIEVSDNIFTSQSSGSTSNDNSGEKHSRDNSSSKYVHLSADEGPEFLRSPVSKVFGESKKEPGMSLPSKQTPQGVDSAKQATNSEVVTASELPSFLSFVSGTPSLEDTEYGSSKETSLQEKDGEMNGALPEDGKPPPPLAGDNVMNVILVAVECAPWSKTGGLGDVAGALPKALARRGHRVMVIAPRYDNYEEAQQIGIRKRYKVEGQDIEVVYYHAFIDGVDFVFMEAAMFRHMGNDIYGGNRMDILKRMVLFCKAAVEVPWLVPCGGACYGDGNLVFIANDWHTALLPVYLKAYHRDNGLMTFTRSVLVIHNIAHQGRGPVEDFKYLDLPRHYLDLFKMYDPVGGEHLNILAAGLKTADRVVTVSRGYAWEIRTPEGGWGLHGVINENDWKLTGIVNGVDTQEWSPQHDTHLKSDGYTNYSLESLQTGKGKCKAALQRELGFPVRSDVPLISFIGRLDHQKGVDIIAEAIPWMMEQDVQLVMLGTGRPDLESMLMHFENRYKGKMRGWVGFSVKKAHRITAGADVLVMPSRFEPCGLNQLYAMRYGTVPVVHAVGGLRETVEAFDPIREAGVGWTYGGEGPGSLMESLGNCLLTYREYRGSWEGIQRRGMEKDLSWDSVAHNYEEILVAAKYQW